MQHVFRMTIAEIEAWLRRRTIQLQPSVNGVAYATDSHFRLFVYDRVNSKADVIDLCDRLDKECGGRCTKATEIRDRMRNPFWSESLDGMRSVLASARRVCCKVHETGSYAMAENKKGYEMLDPRFQGLFTNRLEREPLERKFAEAWRRFNVSWRLTDDVTDSRTALAQMLNDGDQGYPQPPSARDFKVAATVIQWLGSACGQAFLCNVLDRPIGKL